MFKIFQKLKWHRIGYTEGHVTINDDNVRLVARSIMYVRAPFLWFRTRKVKEIGDIERIKIIGASPHYRNYKLDVQNWLLGGKIPYVSENGTNRPADIIKLVKK